MKNVHPTFAKRQAFGKAISKEISDYFSEPGRRRTGDWRLWHKTIVLMTLLVATYIALVWYHTELPIVVAIGLCLLISFLKASIGFNVMHDANHKAYAANKRVNYIAGLSLNLLGANAFLWKVKHNECHHPYTNLVGHDEDVSAPLMRFHKEQPRRWYHRLQFLYWPFMYGLLYFGWIYFTDFKKYFRRRVEQHGFVIPPAEHALFWVSKAVYVVVFVVLPLQYVPLGTFLIAYAGILFACGLFIALVFQLAHVVEEVAQPTVVPQMAEEHIYHQVITTANFGTRSRILRWCCGGLTHQIEHHIVPHVSHVHYPALSKRVKSVCAAFGVPYHTTTFWSHLRHLYVMGR